MALLIKSMKLESFKSYRDVTIIFNENFNVIIGDNNIGKTTIFESMLLWKKCFDIQIKTNRSEFYKLGNSLYVNFEELYFMRLAQDTDIFNKGKSTCKIIIELYENTDKINFSLGFKLTKPQNIPNSYIRMTMINSDEFIRFQEYYKNKTIKLTNTIYFHQTKPVSNVLSKEPYMYDGQIIKKMEKGKSNEVLRNKIIRSISLNKDKLITYMKNVLEIEFSFETPKRTRSKHYEYIDLKVNVNNSSLDIFLQGSGFLQVAEIFSTIDTLDNALNVLLIDEPDSHISARIQAKLLNELKSIKNTQIFVISHNDNFVANLEPEEVIFINSDNKEAAMVECLKAIDFDKIHDAMGGIISSLTQMQKSKKIVLVEGNDDISYIKRLYNKISSINNTNELALDSDGNVCFKDVAFWNIRGKDYLKIKLENYKNMISQLVNNKRYFVLFDKDFSDSNSNQNLIKLIEFKNKFKCFVHDGYCIESVLFSQHDILADFLNRVSGIELDKINEFIIAFKATLVDELSSVSSIKYKKMKGQFASQKKDSRPELNGVDFDTVASEFSINYHYAMNKDNIRDFILKFENLRGSKLFERDDDESETYASNLLNIYIEQIETVEGIYEGYKNLINFILLK